MSSAFLGCTPLDWVTVLYIYVFDFLMFPLRFYSCSSEMLVCSFLFCNHCVWLWDHDNVDFRKWAKRCSIFCCFLDEKFLEVISFIKLVWPNLLPGPRALFYRRFWSINATASIAKRMFSLYASSWMCFSHFLFIRS